MTPEPAPAGRSRPAGQRGPKLRARILAATLAELAEKGYAALTVDNVAHRAAVHKTTIYRRWGNRARLVADAVADRAATNVPFRDTGDIDADLRWYARSLVTWMNSPAGRMVTAATLSEAARIPDITEARHRFFAGRFGLAESVVAGAVARGELPAGTDPAELIKTVIAPIYLRILVIDEPIDRAVADRAAEVALTAARAGLLRAGGVDPAGAAGRTARLTRPRAGRLS
ncbi:MAG TPA: TetR/AcrR family transcriptional regulator [Streptosporangiaceae bacterium]|nr:TetR/AcrR family transcriptional regulator [Streptosporangiaceae bacterium]